MQKTAAELQHLLKETDAYQVLGTLLRRYRGQIAFASSLGAEDQVLTDMIMKIDSNTRIFTIDTGRLHEETVQLIERTNAFYDTKIQVFFPEAENVEKIVSEKGMFSFFESVEERKYCCYARKIEPLSRALAGVKVWITGLRAMQATTRLDLNTVEFDDLNGLIKVNPLIHWSEEAVWEYIKEHKVPYNKLHDQGYRSIGCAPCSRSIGVDDDVRSGRWWWEDPSSKECGLHKR